MKKLELSKTKEISSPILILVIGLVLLLIPDDILLLAIRLIGIAIVIVSGIGIYDNVKNNKETELAYNILILILGIIVISSPTVIAGIIPFLVGAWTIIKSAFKILLLKDSIDKTPLIISVITLIIGIAIILHPFGSASLVLRLIGGFLVAYAIMEFIDINNSKPKKVKVIK